MQDHKIVSKQEWLAAREAQQPRFRQAAEHTREQSPCQLGH